MDLMEFPVYEDETIDTLTNSGKKIIQKKNGFRFSIDSVLLVNFLEFKRKGILVDFGTGTAVMPIMLAEKDKIEKIIAVEIQENIAEMAKRSVAVNDLNHRIDVALCDINNINDIIKNHSVDYVISNPPYIEIENGNISVNDMKAASIHEVHITLDILINRAKQILKSGGTFSIIYRTARLQELMAKLLSENMFVGRMRFIYTVHGKNPLLVMIEAVKEKKAQLNIMEPLYIYDGSNNYTKEVEEYFTFKTEKQL